MHADITLFIKHSFLFKIQQSSGVLEREKIIDEQSNKYFRD